MANIFTRALDRFTPWDRGGEVQRRKEREEPQYTAPQPQQTNNAPRLQVTNRPNNQIVSVEGNEPAPVKPENRFVNNANRNFVLNKPKNAVDVINSMANKPTLVPKPGAVITPYERPQQTVSVDTRRPTNNIQLPNGRTLQTQAQAPTEEEIAIRKVDAGLDSGKSWEQIARENRFDVSAVKAYSETTRPNYGIRVQAPQKQGFSERVRDIFDTNTQADQFRRQEGNDLRNDGKNIRLQNPGNIISQTPIVGHVTKVLNTMGAQIAQMPATAEGMFLTRQQNSLTEQMMEAQRNGNDALYVALAKRVEELAGRVNEVFASQRASTSMFQDNSGGLFNAGTLYNEEQAAEGSASTAFKEVALPTAVAALDLFTLGKGNLIAEGFKRPAYNVGGKATTQAILNQQKGNIAKTVGGNFGSGYLDAEANDASFGDALTAGAINAAIGTVADVGLPALGRKFSPFKGNIFKGGANVGSRGAISELEDNAIKSSVDDLIRENPTKIPVTQARNIPVTKVTDIPVAQSRNIPVEGSEFGAQPVNVRNMTEPKPLIQDVAGGESLATPDPLIKQFGQDVKNEAGIAQNNATKPNQRSIDLDQGITPRKAETFKLDENTVIKSQDDAVNEYAKWLKEMGEGNGVAMVPDGEAYGYGVKRQTQNVRFGDTKGKRMTKQMWQDEARRQLDEGIADPGIQKPFNDAANPEVQSLLKNGEQAPGPQSRPITVKQVNSIPVEDKTTNLTPTPVKETPGTVRVSTQTSPNNVKSEIVASKTPAVSPKPSVVPEAKATPSGLPTVSKVGDTLPDGKIVTKRTVKAQRANLRRAEKSLEIKEKTKKVTDKLDESREDTGLAPTGKFKTGKKGNVYETGTKQTEEALAKQEVATKSVDDILNQVEGKSKLTPQDIRNVNETLESLKKAYPNDYADLPAYKGLKAAVIGDNTKAAQQMGLIHKMSRRISTGDQMTSKWEDKMAGAQDNPTKVTTQQLDAVRSASNAFEAARDKASQAGLNLQGKTDVTDADVASFKALKKAEADTLYEAYKTELLTAKEVLKGSKAANAAQVMNDLAKQADLGMMDYVTANQLSGIATGFRNFVGSELAGIENRVGANLRAKITNKLFKGTNVGGYSRAGAREGRVEGFKNMGTKINERAKYAGKNPFRHAQNFGTSMNAMGDSTMAAQVKSRLVAFYETQVRNETAFKGASEKQIQNAAQVRVLVDDIPGNLNMGRTFKDAVDRSSGLTGTLKRTQRIEDSWSKVLAEHVFGKVLPPKGADFAGKAVGRLTLGYPTAAGNFVIQSGKRIALGTPSFIESGVLLKQGNKQAAAEAFDRGLKEAGSGAAALGTGMMLGNAGLVSGFYPEDKDERQRWKDEGKSELSIKIPGIGWQPIPQGFGMFGLPLLAGATLAEGGWEKFQTDFTRKNIFKLLPADQVKGVMQVFSGGATENQDKSFVASTISSFIPASSFLRQTASGLQENISDTTTKDFWSNVRDQVLVGLPGGNKLTDVPNKVSSTGELIKSPNLVQAALGARSVEQKSGVENSKKVDGEINDILKNIDKHGALKDTNITAVLEGTGKEAFDKAQQGKQLDESEIKALQEGLVKSISEEGTDSVYLEKEQYASNIAALKMKKDLMESDPTTKPSSLKNIETAIKRGEVYKNDKIPYDLISKYKTGDGGVGVEEWRKMGDESWIEDGDPQPDEYDPEMYQKLWDMDQKMTNAGVSYGKELDKGKYYVVEKKSGSGRGGSGSGGSKKIGTGFGKLKAGSFAPSVKKYQTIDTQTGSIPRIAVKRSNIVHKVGVGR